LKWVITRKAVKMHINTATRTKISAKMNVIEYDQIFNYLQNPNQKHVPKKVIQQSAQYTMLEDRLYRKYGDRLLLVIKSPEVDQIVSYTHEHPMSGHFGIEKIILQTMQLPRKNYDSNNNNNNNSSSSSGGGEDDDSNDSNETNPIHTQHTSFAVLRHTSFAVAI